MQLNYSVTFSALVPLHHLVLAAEPFILNEHFRSVLSVSGYNIRDLDSLHVSKSKHIFLPCILGLYSLSGIWLKDEERNKPALRMTFLTTCVLNLHIWGDRAVNISTVFVEDISIYAEMG